MKDYYDKIAHLYDLMYNETTGFDRMAHVQWVDEWREKCGLPKIVLDVACGTGKHLACFETLGYTCFGIDASLEMLKIAKRELTNTSLQQGYFHTFRLSSQVALITCFFNALTYNKNVDELRAALQNIYDNLSYGGLFIFDVVCTASPQRVFNVKTFEADGINFSRTFMGTPTDAGYQSRIYYVVFDGAASEVIEETTLRGTFSEEAIRQTLADCNFTILHTRSGFTVGTTVFVAQK